MGKERAARESVKVGLRSVAEKQYWHAEGLRPRHEPGLEAGLCFRSHHRVLAVVGKRRSLVGVGWVHSAR